MANFNNQRDLIFQKLAAMGGAVPQQIQRGVGSLGSGLGNLGSSLLAGLTDTSKEAREKAAETSFDSGEIRGTPGQISGNHIILPQDVSQLQSLVAVGEILARSQPIVTKILSSFFDKNKNKKKRVMDKSGGA